MNSLSIELDHQLEELLDEVVRDTEKLRQIGTAAHPDQES